jgi:hypothetical protein
MEVRRHVLALQRLPPTSSGVSIRTFVLVKQVN